MDKAQSAVSNFMSKAGHHDTTVHEQVAPAVKHETVKPAQHEETNTAINREFHQDHYRRVVQPVQDREVLPEQHIHKASNVIHREVDHSDKEATERTLRAEAGKLRDQRVVADTTYTQSQAPVVQGEQVHHHIHETIQPVIQKEIIQPHVIHTTVPIHEVHHNPARHHGTTTMPPVSMDEFKKQGGALGSSGQTEHTEAFEGCPEGAHQSKGNSRGSLTHSSSSSASSTSAGDSHTRGDVGSVKTGISTGEKKPSLIDRLNPLKDADGDGKSGIMS